MKIFIEINTDNAAFEDNVDELDMILIDATHKVGFMSVGDAENLYDTNGNRCGSVTITD